MRIGFDARSIGWRGIGTYSRNLLREFASADVEVVVLCTDADRESIPVGEAFELMSSNDDPRSSRGRAAFLTQVERAGIDLLHVPSPWAPTPAPVPFVATIHDVNPLIYPRSIKNPLKRRRYRRQLDRTLAEARCIITVSEISHSALSVYAGVDPFKVRVIHNGVSTQFRPVTDPEILGGARRRYGLPERFAFWVGEFRREKNLEFLVRAWHKLAMKLSEPLPLVLAGSQGDDYSSVVREVRRYGLDNAIHFPGFIREEDLAAAYSAARVFVFPSLYEGFGFPPLEAMACGIPCVVSNSSSLPEITGRAAMLFNPTATDQLVECIIRLMNDEVLDANLREQGLRRAEHFSWARAADRTLDVYEGVLYPEEDAT